MRTMRAFMTALVFLGILSLAGESSAVIYKYLDEKGEQIYVDDLTKVPEKDRAKAIIVTGRQEQELTDDTERARALALKEQSVTPVQQTPHAHVETKAQAPQNFVSRLVISGAATAAVAAILFVMMNFDALKEKKELVRKIRVGLIIVLLLLIGITHAGDVVGLFRTAGETVASPLAGVQDRQAEKGRKAAETYKAMDQALQEKVQQEADRIQRQFDAAEQGR